MEPFPFLRRFPSQLLLFFRVPREHVVVVFQVGKMAEFLKGTGWVHLGGHRRRQDIFQTPQLLQRQGAVRANSRKV